MQMQQQQQQHVPSFFHPSPPPPVSVSAAASPSSIPSSRNVVVQQPAALSLEEAFASLLCSYQALDPKQRHQRMRNLCAGAARDASSGGVDIISEMFGILGNSLPTSGSESADAFDDGAVTSNVDESSVEIENISGGSIDDGFYNSQSWFCGGNEFGGTNGTSVSRNEVSVFLEERRRFFFAF